MARCAAPTRSPSMRLALPEQGRALVVEPGDQHRALVAGRRRIRPGHRGQHRPRLTGRSGEIIGREGAGSMAFVRERWLSGRAVSLHLAVLVVVPGCALAAWWQINRAADGNQLSYLYSVMWPVFGLLAHVLLVDAHPHRLRDGRPEGHAAPAGRGGHRASRTAARRGYPSRPPVIASATDDPELAAYNARLAELAAKGPKTWRHRESAVVRWDAVTAHRTRPERGALPLPVDGQHRRRADHPAVRLHRAALRASAASRSSSPSSAWATATSTSST